MCNKCLILFYYSIYFNLLHRKPHHYVIRLYCLVIVSVAYGLVTQSHMRIHLYIPFTRYDFYE